MKWLYNLPPMKAWERWSYKQYDIWGKHLREKYNFWKEYDDPEKRKLCQAIWNSLSPSLQKKIYAMLVEVMEAYGPEFAKNLIKKLSEAFV